MDGGGTDNLGAEGYSERRKKEADRSAADRLTRTSSRTRLIPTMRAGARRGPHPHFIAAWISLGGHKRGPGVTISFRFPQSLEGDVLGDGDSGGLSCS